MLIDTRFTLPQMVLAAFVISILLTFMFSAVASADENGCNTEVERNDYFSGQALSQSDLASAEIQTSDSSTVQRVSYFEGRILSAYDLQTEQTDSQKLTHSLDAEKENAADSDAKVDFEIQFGFAQYSESQEQASNTIKKYREQEQSLTDNWCA